MKIAVILNGISLEKRTFYKKFLPALHALFSVNVYETHSKHDAVSLASKAVEKRYDVIISAGGDGTIHQIVNGVLQKRENFSDLPALAVLPIGTGNDFARCVNAPQKIKQLVEQLNRFTTKAIDVGTVEYSLNSSNAKQKEKCYFINVVDVGMGPEVVKKVLESGRPLGSEIAYYTSIISTFFSYKPMMLHARTSEWEWHSNMRTFAVANGKYYGHGLCIAPDAVADDGVFEVFACGDVSVLDFMIQSVPLKKGKYVKHEQVSYKKTTSIELTSDKPCLIEADGEMLGWLPAKIEIIPNKLKFLF